MKWKPLPWFSVCKPVPFHALLQAEMEKGAMEGSLLPPESISLLFPATRSLLPDPPGTRCVPVTTFLMPFENVQLPAPFSALLPASQNARLVHNLALTREIKNYVLDSESHRWRGSKPLNDFISRTSTFFQGM